jgi:hypothetical protein
MICAPVDLSRSLAEDADIDLAMRAAREAPGPPSRGGHAGDSPAIALMRCHRVRIGADIRALFHENAS